MPAEAAERLRLALALWRGPPCSGVSGSLSLEREARRLDDLRMAALEDRIEADLAIDRYT